MLQRTLKAPLVALVTALLTGCPSGDEPVINAFSANPTTVMKGGTTTLMWDVTGADTIKITANPGGEVVASAEAKGSKVSAALDQNTTFTLEATNGEGTVSRTISVMVQEVGAPTIDSFTATPMMVTSGGQVVLAWETTNADSVDITPNVLTNGQPDGQTTTNVQETTTFTLTARNASGTATSELVVTVVGPRITSFTATPQAVTLGDTVTLAWTVADAAMVTITNDAGDTVYEGTDLTGSTVHAPVVAAPPGTVTYTLTAVDEENRSIAAMTTVNVNPVGGPTIQFAANPTSIALGETSTLRWTVTNAVDIEILAGATTATRTTELVGSLEVRPLETTEYTLVARSADNLTAMAMATVTVQPGPPAILAFEATPNPAALGDEVTLSWNTIAADTVRILNGTTELLVTTNNSGTATVTPTATSTVYTIEATNTLGTNTDSITVYAHPAPVINDFTVTPLSFTGSSTVVTVTWDVENVATLELLANGAPAANFPAVDVSPMITDDAGTFTITINAATEFTLIATSAGGVERRNANVISTFAETEPNDSPAEANAHPGDGSGASAAIDVPLDVDWYVVTVPPGGNLVAETSDGMGGCATDTQIRVFAETDTTNPIAFNDDIDLFGGIYCSRVTPYDDPDVAPDPDLADMAGGTYYIRVNAYQNGTGPYVLTVTVRNAECGNTLFEGNEQCDDGNTVSGDGCDASCNYEINPTVINPPGGSVSVNLPVQGGFQLVRVDLTAPGQSITATAADVGGTTCNSVDTAIVLTDANFLGIDVVYDGGPTGTAGECAAIHFPATRFATNLDAGTYYLAVFNLGGPGGSVQVDVGIIDPSCGDGVVNAGEACDDGNLMSGDGCADDCTVEPNMAVMLPGPTPVVLSGAIDPVGEHEFYEIVVTEQLYFYARTFTPNQAAGCTGGDTVLVLRDANGNVLGSNDDYVGRCSQISSADPFALLQPGTYTLEIHEYGDDSVISSFEILVSSSPYNAPVSEVEPNDDPSVATPLTLLPGVNAVAAAINPAGDLDFYTFTLAAPANVTIATLAPSGASICTGDTQLWLYNAIPTNFTTTDPSVEPALVEFDDDGGPELCSLMGDLSSPRSLPAGTYYLQVREYQSNDVIASYYLHIDLQ